MTDPAQRLTFALADRYRFERALGAGGMATVYLAADLKHDRKVAIKVLKPELAAVLGAERFVQEIKTTAALSHPHILPLFDSGEADGFLYYVMPYIQGETIREKLNRETQFGIEEALRITTEVADALDYAHRHGVIHRDIKPENILLHDGRPMVMDFGIALAVSAAAGGRMTETGLSLGTPHYMSPEQATADKAITGRSDIYSLASVMYEMLAGVPPHEGGSAQQVIMRIIADTPRPVRELRKAVPPNVAAALAQALEKLPADRFDSAKAFADALANPSFGAARGEGMHRVGLVSARGFSWWIRSPWSWVAVGALAIAVTIAWSRQRSVVSSDLAVVRPIRLTHSGGVGCATISPDGREFAAVLGSYSEETECVGKLVVRAVPTGVDQVLLPNVDGVFRIRWNPAGTMLLFYGRPENKPSGLWILTRGTGALRQLSTSPLRSFGFADDQRVFTIGRSGVRLVDPTSGEVRDSLPQLRADEQTRIDWSPDGKRLLVENPVGRRGVFIMTTSGIATDSLMANSNGDVDNAYWAGPGRIVYYQNRGYGPGDLFTREIDLSTGRLRSAPAVLWAALPALRGASASRAGDRVMVVVRPVVDEQHLMQLSAPTTSRVLVRSLNAYLGDPFFSPNAMRIAYTREDALGFNGYWIGVDGGEEHPMGGDTTAITGAQWIDDHRVMTLSAAGALTEVDLETGRMRNQADSGSLHLIDYLGDSRLWRMGDSLHLIVTGEQGSPRQDLGTPPGLQSITSHWFPTTSYLVLSGRTRDQPLAMVGYSFTARRWSEPVPLPLASEGFRIAGAGSDGSIYFARLENERTEIWRSPNYASPPTHLSTLPVHCYNVSVNVSQDGKRVVCNVTTSEPDAWLIDLRSRN